MQTPLYSLTNTQYQHLQQYLAEFTERLNHTTTRDDAIPLFNEAVMELHKFGLLPEGLSVVQAQHLVTGNQHVANIQQSLMARSRTSMTNNSTNSFCLLAGYSNSTELITSFQWAVLFGFGLICEILYALPPPIYLILALVFFGITTVLYTLGYLIPLSLWSDIKIFGGHGFLFTLGFAGLKKWVGYLDGEIHGFTGIKILLDLKDPIKFFYLGSAMQVQME